MSNQEMCNGGGPVTNQNSRGELEQILGENLISASKVQELVYQVSDSLFGVKPLEAGEGKESAKPPGGIFNRTKDVALRTKYRLGEIRDKLSEILQELK